MRIVLFRHGPAEARDPERWPDDLDRPLTARGQARTHRAARGVVKLEPGVMRVFASPARRARETALLLAGELGVAGGAETMDSLAPGGSWRETLRALAREGVDGSVALVGHEPDLGQLAGVLLFGATGVVPLKKAGACAIEAEAPEAGGGRLRWLLPPSALSDHARKRRKS